MILIAMTVLFLCISYAIAQISTLQLDDYWCEPITLQEIRKHSIEYGLDHGETQECFTLTESVNSFISYTVHILYIYCTYIDKGE